MLSMCYVRFLALDSEISCCFERGGKMSSSLDNTPVFSEHDESCEVGFHETLSLVATMYKDKTKGTFQEKPACLVVRIKKKSARRGQIYQGIICDLSLII